MAERRIVDIGPLLEDLKKELEDLEGSTEALTVEEATEEATETAARNFNDIARRLKNK